MSVQLLVGLILAWMSICGACLIGWEAYLRGRKNGDPILAVVVMVVLFSLAGLILWPLSFALAVARMQTELGIFWRGSAWKPDSITVLEVLRWYGREMSANEIHAASRGLGRWRCGVVLQPLINAGLVVSRQRRYSITDRGQKFLLSEDVFTSPVGLSGMIPWFR